MESNHKQIISKGEYDGDVNNQPGYDPADPEEEFKSMISSKNEEFKSMSSNSN